MKKAHKTILAEIGQAARKAGIKAWAVGGFVRDLYLGRDTIDIDICVEGDPSALIDFCVKKYGAEAKHFSGFGTARVNLIDGLKLDFVRCRKEMYPKPAALPEVSPSILHDDLFRRDFTANACALSILPGEFFKSYDLFDSQKAIEGKYIQILHARSFEDDPTRIFRAIRFASRFNWKIERGTAAFLHRAVKEGLISKLSRERVANEFIKILGEQDPLPAFKMLDKYKLSPFIFPKIKYPKCITEIKGLNGRLALMALAQKKEAEEFAKSLHLPHAVLAEILSIVDFYNSKLAPMRELTREQKRIINVFNPKFQKFKFKKSFITGGDIKVLGYEGKEIKNIYNSVSAKQRAGTIKNKASAIKFIKNKTKK